jgi:hypothetical protein
MPSPRRITSSSRSRSSGYSRAARGQRRQRALLVAQLQLVDARQLALEAHAQRTHAPVAGHLLQQLGELVEALALAEHVLHRRQDVGVAAVVGQRGLVVRQGPLRVVQRAHVQLCQV